MENKDTRLHELSVLFLLELVGFHRSHCARNWGFKSGNREVSVFFGL